MSLSSGSLGERSAAAATLPRTNQYKKDYGLDANGNVVPLAAATTLNKASLLTALGAGATEKINHLEIEVTGNDTTTATTLQIGSGTAVPILKGGVEEINGLIVDGVYEECDDFTIVLAVGSSARIRVGTFTQGGQAN